MRQVELAPQPVDIRICREQHIVNVAAQLREPGAAFHDTVEFIAMEHEHSLAVCALMNVFAMDFQVAENGTVEFAEYFIVVAGDEYHFGAALGFAQYRAQNIVVRLRPKHRFLHVPYVDDVTHQEQGIHFDMVQEIEQQFRATSSEAQMNVRYEDRAQSQRRWVAIHHASLPGIPRTTNTWSQSRFVVTDP